MLTPKFRKSPAAERIRRLLHTCVGSLKIPRKGGRHVLRIDLLRPPAFRRGLFLPPRPAGQEKAPETLVSGGLLDAWRFAYAAASAAAGIS